MPYPADERSAQLLAAIRRSVDNDHLEWAIPPRPLTGGFTSEMWRIELRGSPELSGPLVARILPDPAAARRETTVQRYVAEHGYPTPAVRLSNGPLPELDQAWLLMDEVAATPMLATLERPNPLALIRHVRTLPAVLARCAAALHDVSAEPLRAKLATEDDIADLLERIGTRMASAGRQDLVTASEWLASTRPARGREVICHGDLHPLNVLVGNGAPVVIDWSTAQIADRAHDIAFTMLLLSHPPLDVPAPMRAPLRLTGRHLARRFRRAYERCRGHAVAEEQLDWHARLGALRVLSELEVTIDPLGHPFSSMADSCSHLLSAAPVGRGHSITRRLRSRP